MLDKILGAAMQGMMGGQQQSGLMGILMQLMSSPGGLQGMLQQFQQAGLGQQAQSWVSTGQNMPISPDDLMKVFGQGQMQQWSQSLGMNPQETAGGLASVLPNFIDQLTPKGQMPQANEMDALLGGLKKSLGM